MRKLSITISFVFMALIFSVNSVYAQPQRGNMTDVCDYDKLIFEFNQKADAANKKLEEVPSKNMEKETHQPKRTSPKKGDKVTLNDDIWHQIRIGFVNHP